MHFLPVVEDEPIREALLRLREEAEPLPLGDRLRLDAECCGDLDAGNEVLEVHAPVPMQGPHPEVGSVPNGAKQSLRGAN